VATLTSISGPPLAHAGSWMRDRLRRRDVRALASQGVRSSYVAGFHLPGVPTVARLLGKEDVANGINLYRANIRPGLQRPARFTVEVPVQLVVARRDPFVPPRLLEGIEAFAPDLRRVEIGAGHWVVRTHADRVAAVIASFVDGGTGRLDDLRDEAPA
jgi:pimeloyl-ACP methyl ester carboxylesterase